MGTRRHGISLQVFYSIHSQLTSEYRKQVRCWVEHEKRNSIHLYLQATMYYFVPYMSTRGFHWLEKLALFTNEKIGSTIPAKSWKVQLISHIKHTCKIIVFFSHVLLWLFSGLEILVQHHSLYNKWGWQRVGGSLIPFHAWILKKYSCVTNTINCVSHVTDLEGKTSNYSSCVQCCRKIFRFSRNVRKHSQVMSSGGLMNVSS